jgi:hypothetical protein
VALDLDDRVTDRFDGVIGFAPNSENSEDNSLLLTGELNIELNNLFRSAKQMKLHWRNYLKRSQLLDVELTWPYLFNTKIGINGALNINKFDTLYVTLNSKLGFRYQQSGNNYLQVYYQYTGSNLITADTNYVRSQKRIPVNNPFRVDNYGITLYQSDLDYLPNPRRGYQFSLDMAIGVKQLLRNIQIEAVRFPAPSGSGTISIYDTLTKNSLRGRFDFSGSFYIPVFKRSTLLNQVRLSGIIANQVLFNELYNFGGFGSLKGFDENSIFASKYALYNLEYRYLLAQNSSVGLFMNVAVIENKLESDLLVYDVPYGFGAIAMIEVRNGILSLAFALGSEQGNAIRLSTSKLHFGIVNYF